MSILAKRSASGSLIDCNQISIVVWASGVEVWSTVSCCPHGRAAICTACPYGDGARIFNHHDCKLIAEIVVFVRRETALLFYATSL